MPVFPGFAATAGAMARPRRVPVVSVNACDRGRSTSAGRAAQPPRIAPSGKAIRRIALRERDRACGDVGPKSNTGHDAPCHGCPAMKRPAAFATAALAALAVSASLAQAAEPRRVLVINSFGRDFAPFNSVASAFRIELARLMPGGLVFHEVSLDAERAGPPEEELPIVDFLLKRYANAPPDLVVAVGAPAQRFHLRSRAQLFPQTPLLVTAIDHRMVQGAELGAGDRVVSVKLDLAGVARNALEVLPDTKLLAFVLGASSHEQGWLREVQRELAPLDGRVRLLPLVGLTLGQLRERAAALPRGSAVLYFMYAVGPDGVAQGNEAALSAVREASSAPVF